MFQYGGLFVWIRILEEMLWRKIPTERPREIWKDGPNYMSILCFYLEDISYTSLLSLENVSGTLLVVNCIDILISCVKEFPFNYLGFRSFLSPLTTALKHRLLAGKSNGHLMTADYLGLRNIRQ